MLYLAYEAQRAALLPARLLAGVTKAALDTLPRSGRPRAVRCGPRRRLRDARCGPS